MFNLNKLPKEGTHYEFIETPEVTSVKLIKGKYKDIVYNYGTVKVVPDESKPTVQFDYTVTNFGKHEPDLLTADKKFTKMMGDILINIFETEMNGFDWTKKEEDESSGIIDTEEPDLQ
jgi:hypothetical protein